MKQVVIILIVVLLGNGAFSQNRATVILEQIAKFEVYLSYLKKGYDIVNKGLTLIGDIKHGDFNLHKDYFNSLDQVNPQIKSDVKIAAMIAMQVEMLSSYKAYYQQFRASGVFTNQEINYFYSVFTTLLNDVAEDITELTNVVTDGQLQMKDDERINRIDKLYTGMTGKYNFLYSFADQVQVQSLQRQKELQELKTIQKMY
jgi:hypothetical protein